MNAATHTLLYQETVSLQSHARTLLWFASSAAALVAALVLNSQYAGDPDVGQMVRLLVRALFLLTGGGFLTVILDIATSELRIEVTSEALNLRFKFFRVAHLTLKDIADATPGSPKLMRRWRSWLLYFQSALTRIIDEFYLVSDSVPTSVKLSLRNGRTIEFATRNPDGLADILRRESARAFRANTLAMVEDYRKLS